MASNLIVKYTPTYFRHTHTLTTGEYKIAILQKYFYLWSTFVVTDSLDIYAMISFAVHKILLAFCCSDDSNASMTPIAHGKLAISYRPCFMESRSCCVSGNFTNSSSLRGSATVTRRIILHTLDLYKPETVSPVTCWKLPDAKNRSVISTRIVAEIGWLRFVVGLVSSSVRRVMYT